MARLITTPVLAILTAAVAQAQVTTIQLTVDNVVRPATSFAEERFGAHIDADGNRVVISAPGDSNSTNPDLWSRAEVWRRTGGSWTRDLAGVLTPSYARIENDDFGISVAISGNTAIVGAPDYSDDGAAVIYHRGTSLPILGWFQKKLLTGDATLGYAFGSVVEVDQDTAAACGTSFAKVFERNEGGAGNWGETATFDNGTELFCSDLAIDGDWMVIGNRFFDTTTTVNSGLVYVYQRSAGPDAWVLVTQLGPASPTSNLQLGSEVGIFEAPDHTIYVAAGSVQGVRIWKRPLGQNFIVDTTLTQPIGGFGFHMAMDGLSMLVSASATVSSQRVYLYRRADGSWQAMAGYLSFGESSFQHFGATLGLSAGLMVAGSPGGDVLSVNSNDGWINDLPGVIFSDDLEAGNLAAWSASVP